MDMTNSFFQTRMHMDNIPLTAVNTPWGLYKWVVMPMGIKNMPAIHQHQVTNALQPWIGQICHVYLKDIVIWSDTMDQHTKNIRMILHALQTHKLYCNPKKTKLFCMEISFLGLVCYLAALLPSLAKHTAILNMLTKKECDKHFLGWTQ